ncbi:glycosyltransferase [Lysobacter sp. HA18]
MKALVLVTTSFPVRGDGSEAAGAFVADIAIALSSRLPIRVVAPGPSNTRESLTDNVEVFRFAAPEKALSTLSPMNPRDLVSLHRVLSSGAAAALDAVRAGPTSHQLALWALPSGHWARRVTKITGVPYSVWTLGSDIWSLGRIPIVRGCLRSVLVDADCCFSDGVTLARQTERVAGRSVEFLPSARSLVSKPRTLRGQLPYRLLYVGRWHRNKGVDLLLEALDLLSDADWGRIESIKICGGGPLESAVRAGVERLVRNGRPVACKGYLDRVEVGAAFASSDILLLPSRVESIPVVFSDAMQQGCPVVASPVGDLPDLVTKGGVGWVASAVTPLAFAGALRTALGTDVSTMERALREMARRFSISDHIAPRLLELARAPRAQ